MFSRRITLATLVVLAALAGSLFAGTAPNAPDLVVTKTDSPDPVLPGSNITYTITLTNVGVDPATNVSLSDTTPVNTTFVSFQQTSGPAFTLVTPAVGGTGLVSATIVTFASSATATFQLVVNVNPATPVGSTITNTATATSSDVDANSANNTDTESTAVGAAAVSGIPTLTESMLLALASILAVAAAMKLHR